MTLLLWNGTSSYEYPFPNTRIHVLISHAIKISYGKLRYQADVLWRLQCANCAAGRYFISYPTMSVHKTFFSFLIKLFFSYVFLVFTIIKYLKFSFSLFKNSIVIIFLKFNHTAVWFLIFIIWSNIHENSTSTIFYEEYIFRIS